MIGLGTAATQLDTAVNIAFPAITRGFNLSIGDIQWVVISYVLTYASLLLALGRIGDTVGHALVFRVGLIWSAVALLLVSWSPSYGAMLVFRCLQGVGAALVLSCGAARLQSAQVRIVSAIDVGAMSLCEGAARESLRLGSGKDFVTESSELREISRGGVLKKRKAGDELQRVGLAAHQALERCARGELMGDGCGGEQVVGAELQVAQIGAGFVEVVQLIKSRGRGMSEAGELWENIPDPVTRLVAGSQFRERDGNAGRGICLRVREAVERRHASNLRRPARGASARYIRGPRATASASAKNALNGLSCDWPGSLPGTIETFAPTGVVA